MRCGVTGGAAAGVFISMVDALIVFLVIGTVIFPIGKEDMSLRA
jgi:hypothetical protein